LQADYLYQCNNAENQLDSTQDITAIIRKTRVLTAHVKWSLAVFLSREKLIKINVHFHHHDIQMIFSGEKAELLSVRVDLSIGHRSVWSPCGSVSLYLSIVLLSAQVSL